jgi:hypothetical protein
MKTVYSWKLNFERMMRAVEHSYIRMFESEKKNLNHATTYQRNFNERMTQEVVGILGELAVLDFLKINSDPLVNTYHNIADAGTDVESRATNKLDGHLILRHNDSPERRYIFCTVNYDSVKLIGWLKGEDAMQDKYFRSEQKIKSMYKNPRVLRPAWFVPQDVLFDMKNFEK